MTIQAISKSNRINEYLYNAADYITRRSYDGDSSLLPLAMKCILHDGLMASLQKTGMLSEMVFHGGTCLQRIYGSPRLSEGLDFRMKHELSCAGDFEKFCAGLEDIFRSEFAPMYKIADEDIFFREPQKGMAGLERGAVLTWRIGINAALGAARQVIKIDVENRSPSTIEEARFKPLVEGLPLSGDIYLSVATKREILVNKILSIFQRNRLQYRDCFDIAFIASSYEDVDKNMLYEAIESKTDPAILAQKIAIRKHLFCDPIELDNLWENYRTELEQFLAPSHRDSFVMKQSFDFATGVISRSVEDMEQYLDAAHNLGPCP